LNALKTALDDLKIVDVVRKPAGLSNDLKAGEEFAAPDLFFGYTEGGFGAMSRSSLLPRLTRKMLSYFPEKAFPRASSRIELERTMQGISPK